MSAVSLVTRGIIRKRTPTIVVETSGSTILGVVAIQNETASGIQASSSAIGGADSMPGNNIVQVSSADNTVSGSDSGVSIIKTGHQ